MNGMAVSMGKRYLFADDANLANLDLKKDVGTIKARYHKWGISPSLRKCQSPASERGHTRTEVNDKKDYD